MVGVFSESNGAGLWLKRLQRLQRRAARWFRPPIATDLREARVALAVSYARRAHGTSGRLS
jgi:hypothetical protein